MIQAPRPLRLETVGAATCHNAPATVHHDQIHLYQFFAIAMVTATAA
jgi:hypothetical protein